MADREVKRRLAAILAADVAGYTALMEDDTEGTVAAWQDARDDVVEPAVEVRSGRIVKLTGDGFLVEFPTVQDAVNCAISMQQDLASSSLDFRMGINLGDIIDDGRDVHGEGVNVAARLEGLAKPGGIVISSSVYEQVRNRIEATYEDMGPQNVKNVSAPVQAYAIKIEAAAGPEAQASIASVAVLPFTNMSDDTAQDYFADGMTEDLITDLSKISGLFVPARNSSFAFKGQAIDVEDAAKKLRVRHVLEGSVRKAGNKVRINAQLIDASTSGHIWAERYDGDFDDIFALQDNITSQIVAALKVSLTASDKAEVESKMTSSAEAYDLFLRGRAEYYKYSLEHNIRATELFRQAIATDPDFAEAYSFLSYTLFSGHAHSMVGFEHNWDMALEVAEKAVSLKPDSALALTRLAWVQGFLRQFDAALANFEKSLAIEPNNAETNAAYSGVLNFYGNPDKALKCNQRAQSMNTIAPPSWRFEMGHSQFLLGRYEEAVALFLEAIERAPEFRPPYIYLPCAYIELDRQEDAEEVANLLSRRFPDFTIEAAVNYYPIRLEADRTQMIEGLTKAGVAEA
ncbi:MAG: adenylate/guanylate cyclase domain-containing protein [Rhodospirillaceae bacterium]|nr:adenylate/guanylate cyclase domain-containing protein [Rhodospirillaceae bacterium]